MKTNAAENTPMNTQKNTSDQSLEIQAAESKVAEAERQNAFASKALNLSLLAYVIITAILAATTFWSSRTAERLKAAEKLLNDLQKEKIKADAERQTKLETERVRQEAASELALKTEEVRGEAGARIEQARGEAESKILDARTEAAQRIGKIQKEVAQQQARAAMAELKLLETRKRIEWRSFKGLAFLEALKNGAKGKAQVVYKRDDEEAYVLASRIYIGLREAKWDAAEPIPGKENPDSPWPFALREAGAIGSNSPVLGIVASSNELADRENVQGNPVASLIRAFEIAGPATPSAVSVSEVPVPEGTIKIVVGGRL